MTAIEHQKEAERLWRLAGVRRVDGGDWQVRAARKTATPEQLALLDQADEHRRAAQAIRTKAAQGL